MTKPLIKKKKKILPLNSKFPSSATSSLSALSSLPIPFSLPFLLSHPLGIKCQDHSPVPKVPGDTLLSLC